VRNKFLRTSIEILLDSCEGKWDKINLLSKIPGNEELFEILAANALAMDQIDILRFKLIT
jgi:predicted RNA-binding protein with PUA domain